MSLKPSLASRARAGYAWAGLAVLAVVSLAVYYAIKTRRLALKLEQQHKNTQALTRFMKVSIDQNLCADLEISQNKGKKFAQNTVHGTLPVDDIKRFCSMKCYEKPNQLSLHKRLLNFLFPNADRTKDRSSTGECLRLSETTRRKINRVVDVVRQEQTALITEVVQLADTINRDVVTLALLSLFLIIYLVVRYPKRISALLRRWISTLKQAEDGRTNVKAPWTGVVELDEMAQHFDTFVATMHEFDRRKRNRIIEDRHKLQILLEELPFPTAVTDTLLKIDMANKQFIGLFGMKRAPNQKLLVGMLKKGGRELQKLARQVTESGQQAVVELQVVQQEENLTFETTLLPVRDGTGQVGSLILFLRPLHMVTEN